MSMPKEPDTKQGEPPGPVAPPGWPFVVVVPALTGILWMWWAVQGGFIGLIVGGVPGIFLISSSLSNVFSGGDARISQFMCTGALLGILFSFPIVLTSGILSGVVLLISSLASFVAAGYLAVGEDPVPADVPEPEMGLKLSALSAFDEVAMFAIVLTTWPQAVGSQAKRISSELDTALDVFEENGWLEDPPSYHRTPPPPGEISAEKFPYKEWNFVRLSFESGYEPWPDEPGRERWLSYENNRTAYALALRHPGEPRPWLVCIHGLRNGSPHKSKEISQPEYFHRELGLNLLYPYLPLHGPRSTGVLNGVQLLSGDAMDLLHTGTQATWDIRRLLAWLKLPEQSAPAVAVLGHSLGGYAAALLAGMEDNIDCVISANPSVDPSHMFWRDGLSAATRYLKSEGTTQKHTDKLLYTVSPLAFEPKISKENLTLLASVADRVIPPSEPEGLCQHWDKPRTVWHQGTHFGLLRTSKGREAVTDTLRDSGVLAHVPSGASHQQT